MPCENCEFENSNPRAHKSVSICEKMYLIVNQQGTILSF